MNDVIFRASKLFNNYFIKTRYIFYYNKVNDLLDSERKNLRILRLCDLEAPFIENLPKMLIGKFHSLSEKKSWLLVTYGTDCSFKGYMLLHLPKKIEWYDSLPTKICEARICGLFVFPEFRGKGIAGQLVRFGIEYCSKREIEIWSVVEKLNSSSMTTMRKEGGVTKRKNYLIKILSRNFISICTNPINIYFVYRK